jgi:hypothetical protein
VVDVVDVVEVVVEVDVEVVTGVVVEVTDTVDVDVPSETDDEVEPVSIDLGASLPHEAMVKARTTTVAMRIGFTVGSLARRVAIT